MFTLLNAQGIQTASHVDDTGALRLAIAFSHDEITLRRFAKTSRRVMLAPRGWLQKLHARLFPSLYGTASVVSTNQILAECGLTIPELLCVAKEVEQVDGALFVRSCNDEGWIPFQPEATEPGTAVAPEPTDLDTGRGTGGGEAA